MIDREGILQFVKSMRDDPMSGKEMAEVMLRIRSGDDVAGESDAAEQIRVGSSMASMLSRRRRSKKRSSRPNSRVGLER